MQLSYNELKPGTFIVMNNEPWEVKEADFLRMQQRKPVMRTKLKNLVNGKVQEYTFHQSDTIEEAELERMSARFIYENRGEYWFDEPDNPKNRFSFKKEEIGPIAQFLKPNLEVTALQFHGKTINIDLPIKVEYIVTEAPPAVRGDTTQGGTKSAVIESGTSVNVPLFVETGDIISVNTQTGQYTERIKKS